MVTHKCYYITLLIFYKRNCNLRLDFLIYFRSYLMTFLFSWVLFLKQVFRTFLFFPILLFQEVILFLFFLLLAIFSVILNFSVSISLFYAVFILSLSLINSTILMIIFISLSTLLLKIIYRFHSYYFFLLKKASHWNSHHPLWIFPPITIINYHDSYNFRFEFLISFEIS